MNKGCTHQYNLSTTVCSENKHWEKKKTIIFFSSFLKVIVKQNKKKNHLTPTIRLVKIQGNYQSTSDFRVLKLKRIIRFVF